MPKRTTVEIDEDLLARAKRALGATTTRAAIETALRRVAGDEEARGALRVERQRSYLDRLREHADLDVLASEEMWR